MAENAMCKLKENQMKFCSLMPWTMTGGTCFKFGLADLPIGGRERGRSISAVNLVQFG